MSQYLATITKEWKPKLKALIDDYKARQDRDFFRPTGTQVYVGKQGSGKTISAVTHVTRLKQRYPRSIIVSNLRLQGMVQVNFTTKDNLPSVLQELNPATQYIYFSEMSELEAVLVGVDNGKFGVIYLIDEIHTYFNALESKNIPMYVFTEISQQRKQRKCIIGTSQLFLRMAKPFREQCDNIITCNTIGGILTITKAWDGMTLEQDFSGKLVGTTRKIGWFWHTRAIRSSYDTYQKVVSGAEQYAEINRPLELKNAKKLIPTLK